MRAVLEGLKRLTADDTKAVAGWKEVKEKAPKVWDASKPVRDALIAEGVRILVESVK